MKNVLLIGGGGFIGSNLAYRLDNAGAFRCTIIDTSPRKLAIRYENAPYRFVEADIAVDGETVEECVREADIVVHLAAHVLPRSFLRTPLEVIDTNLFQALKIVEMCIKHRRRLIHFSTCEVYGKSSGSDAPFAEDTSDCTLGPITKHRWIYSNAKQLLDRIIHAHGLASELEYTIVRPFNFVGPLMDWLYSDYNSGDARVFASFMSALLFDQQIKLVDGGANRRCFTFIDDGTAALELILRNPEQTRNQIINIGNPGNETTIRDLAVLMKDIYVREFDESAAPTFVDVMAEDFYGVGYEDCDRRVPDISKLSALGWRPKCDLKETISNSMHYFARHKDVLLQD